MIVKIDKNVLRKLSSITGILLKMHTKKNFVIPRNKKLSHKLMNTIFLTYMLKEHNHPGSGPAIDLRVSKFIIIIKVNKT